MLVSILIPCYNSEHTLRSVVELTMSEFERLEGYDCEFVLVNDNSSDGTSDVIRALSEEHPNVHGVTLMRNFGQHNGLMCAMNYASGDLVVGMDDDMQTHPSQLPIILNEMKKGYDIVYGIYPKSANGALKNLTSLINRKTSQVLLGRPKNIRSSNYWCITRQVRDEVIKYTGFSPYVDGIFYRVTTNIGNVPIEHHKRAYGQSGYTLRKLVRQWTAYFNYSVIPLRIASFVGVAVACVGFVAGVVTIVRKALDPTMIAGWASTTCLLLFLAGLILMVLGIIGEYLGKIILTINQTPQFIVRDYFNLEGPKGRVQERGPHRSSDKGALDR